MKKIIFLIAIVIGLLAIPFTAMFFTNQVNWSFFDFLIMFVLLILVGFSILFTFSKSKNIKMRILLIFLILTSFILIWLELSVGIFNSQLSGN